MLLGYETYISSCIYRNSVFLDIAIKYTTFWYNVNILSRFCFSLAAAAAAKSLQSCLTLCNPIDSSSQGSPIPGILQARTLEWVAISFSNAWKWKVKVKSLSRVQLCATPWTVAHQAPPSMGFSRQEYWRGWPLPSPIYFLDEWIRKLWYIYTMEYYLAIKNNTFESVLLSGWIWSRLYRVK